ncbi:hypothetical protein Rhe02_34550 [Rhizocola hellebori]|uniref:Uncharacterized protein n=1 Tax=Rhizocola hellebori TaxID=1392758 RepID=A0A8J3Q798_9ACTN|nr:hypothetical protein Rhe02_34550 [Rhizocola hellebori]
MYADVWNRTADNEYPSSIRVQQRVPASHLSDSVCAFAYFTQLAVSSTPDLVTSPGYPHDRAAKEAQCECPKTTPQDWWNY